MAPCLHHATSISLYVATQISSTAFLNSQTTCEWEEKILISKIPHFDHLLMVLVYANPTYQIIPLGRTLGAFLHLRTIIVILTLSTMSIILVGMVRCNKVLYGLWIEAVCIRVRSFKKETKLK